MTSSRLTSSSTDIDSASCTWAIEATRRTDSISASRPSALLVRRACSRSRAATVCRLFFTRWWISRMVASLDSSARSRRLTSVTSRISSAAPRPARRAPPAASSGTARPLPGVDLHPHAGPAGQRFADVLGQLLRLERVGDQWAGDGDQVVALQLRGEPHPVVRRQRVGAGEDHHPVDVEADEAVTDPRTGPRHRQVADVGKRALGQHVLQVGGAVQVGPLQGDEVRRSATAVWWVSTATTWLS